MMDLTEQQEQEMIDRAKAGDPEANYNMSLWALEQAMAEPDEERWNRLAAKCLVKAAEAGYAPAKEKMDELLIQTTEPPKPPKAPKPKARPAVSETEDFSETEAEEKPAKSGGQTGKAFASAAGSAVGKVKGLFSKSQGDKPAKAPKAEGEGGKGSGLNFTQWDDAKWKKMQTICIIICVVLAILIAIMLISGRKNKNKNAANDVTIPVADTIATPTPEPGAAGAASQEPAAATPTPAPAVYPPETVRTEIASANLEVFPDDADYVTEATTTTVATSGGELNIRRGPAASFGLVTTVSNGTTMDVYAYKNGFALVKYGENWGWCSKDYLR